MSAKMPAPGFTIAIPPVTLPAVTVVQSPPALVTKHNCEAHMGTPPGAFLEILRAMRADPRFSNQVIVRGKSFRAAAPEAVLAYLRAAPLAGENDTEADEDAGPDDGLLRAAGYESTPKRTGARR